MLEITKFVNNINEDLKNGSINNFKYYESFYEFNSENIYGKEDLEILNEILIHNIENLVIKFSFAKNKNLIDYKKAIKEKYLMVNKKTVYENYVAGFLWNREKINNSNSSLIISKIIINQFDIASKLINSHNRKLNKNGNKLRKNDKFDKTVNDIIKRKNEYYKIGKNFLQLDLQLNLKQAIVFNDFSNITSEFEKEILKQFRIYTIIAKLIQEYEITKDNNFKKIWKDLESGKI